ncbi:hypothetical protein M9H77_20547 [Catharanthus roseus]|uniref:Uncharacterized protein n=1 Tax=Catharanthus roseus TaxID=4058 RepID=A0ACC0AK83_CATRO|nr:hypothetical protein M9H77_20547 [Catharanthus roseus]
MDPFEESLQENVGFEIRNRFFFPHFWGTFKIYNVVAKIKKNRMQERNTVEEVLRLSAERGYTVFYRNGEDSNVLSDIVVAYPTSIAMIRTWPYVLIMYTTYKMNKYYSGLIVLLDIFINLFAQTFKFKFF